MRPRVAPGLTVHVEHVARDGTLAPAEVILATEEPFRSRTRLDAWMLALVSAFDGAHTPRQILAALRARRGVPEEFTQDDLHRLLELLLERGYLETEAGTGPPRGAGRDPAAIRGPGA
jgi:hypothetical protein